jgi:uncharacterized protein (UPF0276 family)
MKNSAAGLASWPVLGFGAGLRAEHYRDVLALRAKHGDDDAGRAPAVDWFEAISENFMDTGGRPLAVLESVRRDYPVALHGVGLSIGSIDPLNERYLERLYALIERIQPALVTDHLCWNGVDGRSLYDLLPLPYTEEALAHVITRVRRVQDALGRRILLENPSTYIAYRASMLPEHEFLAAVAVQTDCGILLDVNNVYVSAMNHGFDPFAYVDAIPVECVGQIHLAGHTDTGSYLFDTHSAPVADAVWDLYAHAVRRFGMVSTLIEWDAEIPPLTRLCEEVERARRVATSVRDAALPAIRPGDMHAQSGRSPALARIADPRA